MRILSCTLNDAAPTRKSVAERAVASAEDGALRRVELEPGADELVDLRLDAKHAADRLPQARGGFDLAAEQSRIEPDAFRYEGLAARAVMLCRRGLEGLRGVEGLRADADHGGHIGAEAIIFRPVGLHDGTRIGPGAEEQLDEAIVEEIEEMDEGRILGLHEGIGFLRQMTGQRPLRAEQAEKGRDDMRAIRRRLRSRERLGARKRPVPARRDLAQRRAGKGHPCLLAEGDRDLFRERLRAQAHDLVAPRGAVADARARMREDAVAVEALAEAALDAAHHVEKVEAPGLALHSFEIAHSALRAPSRAGQRMISPRSFVRSTSCVKWLKAAYSQ